MRMLNKILFGLIIINLLIPLTAIGQNGEITNIQVSQRTDGSGLIDVYFSLSGPGQTYNINIESSFDGGNNYLAVSSNFISGDIVSISTGSGKHLVWDGLGSSPGLFSNQTKLKIIAIYNGIDGKPCPGIPTLTYGGQVYNTVKIGSQCWFAENLNYETPNSWWYNNSSTIGDIYGRLYTWEAALTACPSGWHLPSDNEWKTLEMYLGMSQSEADQTGDRGAAEGEKLKSTSGWYYNGNGTDAVGFAALPGGYHTTYGHFYNLGYYGFWWSASVGGSTVAWYRRLHYNYDKVYRYYHHRVAGFSVRCVRD